MICVGALLITKDYKVKDQPFKYFISDSKSINESRHLEVGDNNQSVTDFILAKLFEAVIGKSLITRESLNSFIVSDTGENQYWLEIKENENGDYLISAFEPAA